MTRKLLLLLALFSFSSALFAKDSGLLTLRQFLQARNLAREDVVCKNQKTEPVVNLVDQSTDADKEVCEVWIPEKVTPARQLTFKDGTPVFMTTREWTEESWEKVPRTDPKSDEFVVKEDQQTTTTRTAIKRYVPKTSP
jgi:hypothetical protein